MCLKPRTTTSPRVLPAGAGADGWRDLRRGARLALLLGAALASRAEDAVQLDPVEVTARRWEDEYRDTPVAVTRHEGVFLEANGIADYETLARVTPGLFVTEQSADNVSLNLRGLTTDTTDPRLPSRVSVFQDGVLLHNAHEQNVALFDLDETAVFKGPQPARFSRGVEGGAIAHVSKRAADESTGSLSASVGDYGAYGGGVVLNRPVAEDTLFVRVAAYQNHRDGYVENLADGSDLQGEDAVAARASLRWQPSKATTIDLIFNYQEDDTPGVALKSMTGIPGLPPPADTNPYTATDLNRGSELGLTRRLFGLAAIVERRIGEAWIFTATSGWRDVEGNHEFDADGTSNYLLEAGERFDGQQFSQDARLDYDAGERLSASVGLAVSKSNDEQRATARTDENTLWRFITRTPPSVPLNPDYSEVFVNDAETLSGDVYGRIDYKLTEKLTLGGGGRLTHEELTTGYESIAASPPGNLAGFAPGSGGTNNFFRNTPGRLENSADEDSWSGGVDVRYATTPRFMPYAGVSRGRRAPILDFNPATLAPRQFEEETVWNHEAGIKGANASGRLRYDASVFYYRFEHFQTNRVVAPGLIAPYDGGRATGRGVETTVQADIARELTVFATYGFTDAEFSEHDENGDPQLYAGNTFRLTSRHVVSLGGTATLPLSGRGAVFVTPLVTYRSEYFFEDDNARNGGILRQGGFAETNLRVGYRPRDGRWEVVGYVENLFDKEYLLDAGNIGGAYGIPTSIRAAPRMFGVRAGVHF